MAAFPKMLRPSDEQVLLNALHAAKEQYEQCRDRMEDASQDQLVKQFTRQIGEVEALIERIECEGDFVACDPENIYNLAGIRQSIAEDRR